MSKSPYIKLCLGPAEKGRKGTVVGGTVVGDYVTNDGMRWLVIERAAGKLKPEQEEAKG